MAAGSIRQEQAAPTNPNVRLPVVGAGGALGAAEGVSYLVVLGIVAWSAATKASTGSGLPAGPAGLLGAVEGLSYLSLLAGVVVFGLKAAGGGLPGIFG